MQQISGLNRGREEREELFTTLYQMAFPAVARYVSKMGGSFDEAKDVFQDALVAYYERSAKGSLIIKSTDKAYILGTAKYLWFKKHKQGRHHIPLENFDAAASDQENESQTESKLMHYLQTAGKKCMDLLRAFYYDHTPLADTAEQFGYSGIRSATVQKYKCLEKVRETIKQKALTYEDFLD